MHYIRGKGYFESSGKHAMSKRQHDLHLARIYGATGNHADYTRLVIESRVSRQLLDEQFRKGASIA